jgi:serine/threonine protein kinase
MGKRDGQVFAMKQFPKNGTGANKFDPSAYVELQMAQLIRQYATAEEQANICMMVESVDDKKDLWLIYEVCEGRTMNEHLFDVKGEFYKGERIYMVHHSHFYHAMRTNLDLLKDFLYRMCLALSAFARLSIVHGDLKPDNIIIDYVPETQSIRSLKIIDLGSSFLLNEEGRTIRNQCEFVQSTPEYLPPEIHSFLSKRFTQ